MALSIPAVMSDVTAAWLTAALTEGGALTSASIVSESKETIGVGVGILGELARVTLEYDRAEAGAPKTVVVKLPTQDPGGRGVAQLLGFYEKEARIYHELAPQLAAPRNYYSARDVAADRYVIVMEDVGSVRQGNQVEGASAADAELLVREMAAMHARWWERAELAALDWLPTLNAPQMLMGQGATMVALDPFLEKFGPDLTERQRGIAVSLAPRVMSMMQSLAEGPRTFLHGDLRLDNIFFGSTDGSRPLTLIDWQISGRGRGPFDIAYFLSQSIDVDARRAHEHEWLKGYHGAVSRKDTGYSWEECWADYRAATLLCAVYPIIAGGSVDLGNERGVELVRQMARRSLTAITDLDADELLSSYAEQAPLLPG
ncbi:MAG: phosphotransferase [Dehalococcoidia bacterium]|nr:phosphotransferase [Dehalococcoidia bacterium]MCB9484632.1 phosphotransferase [Thermoflexaceae bacterium]